MYFDEGILVDYYNSIAGNHYKEHSNTDFFWGSYALIYLRYDVLSS